MLLQIKQERFANLDANLYVVSTDPPERHRQLAERYDFHFRFLSDPEHRLIEKAGLYDAETYRAKRGYALFDPHGHLLLSVQNDQWGEEIERTSQHIEQEMDAWRQAQLSTSTEVTSFLQ